MWLCAIAGAAPDPICRRSGCVSQCDILIAVQASTELRFIVRGYSGRETGATVRLRNLSGSERVRRAAVAVAAWWGAMAVSVFIPVAHFLLVPGCFIGGIAAFALRLRVRVLAVGGETECPDCGAAQALDVGGTWRGFNQLTCRHCQRALRAAPAG